MANTGTTAVSALILSGIALVITIVAMATEYWSVLNTVSFHFIHISCLLQGLISPSDKGSHDLAPFLVPVILVPFLALIG